MSISAFNDTIVALSTASGKGALGVIRLSGDKSLSILSKISSLSDKVKSNQAKFCKIYNKENLIDEVIAVYFKNPKSFTGEDIVEISCHGSEFIIKKIIQLCQKNGARLAYPGEFSQRAYLSGKMDLTQAEAICDLISSQSSAEHNLAISQLKGNVSTEMSEIREQLIHFTAMIELELDFGEEDVEFANRDELEKLLEKLTNKITILQETFEYGNAIKNGIKVAIIGKPNVGKSTLLNIVLQEDRAIVSNIAGTTRDTIEESKIVDGVQLRYIDTAGIRQSTDEIENIGIKKTYQSVEKAQVILYLVNIDSEGELNEIIENTKKWSENKKIGIIHTKDDIYPKDKLKNWENELKLHFEENKNIIIDTINQRNKEKIFDIEYKVVSLLKQNIHEDQTIISNARHMEALNLALNALKKIKDDIDSNMSGEIISFHLKDILFHISSITGDIDFDKDILGDIFENFCIGK